MTNPLQGHYVAIKSEKAGDSKNYQVFAVTGEIAGQIIAAKSDSSGRVDNDQPVKLFTPQEINEGAMFNGHMKALRYATISNSRGKPSASPVVRLPQPAKTLPFRVRRNAP